MDRHFSRKDYESCDYPECKRIKFFVFSIHGYYEKKYRKYLVKDPPGSSQSEDVDVTRMKYGFIQDHIQDNKDAVVYKKNCLVEEFWSELEKMKKDSDLNRYECFFFMFFTFISEESSKGCNSEVDQKLHFSNGLIPIHEILKGISGIKKFVGKPKVIFIQADDCTLMFPKQGCKGPSPVEFETKRIPVDADRLIIQSTIPRQTTHASNESGDKTKGSFLVEAFIEVMGENKKRSMDEKIDLLSLTIDINRKVRQKIEPLAKNLPYPQTTSTFTRFLYLKSSSEGAV